MFRSRRDARYTLREIIELDDTNIFRPLGYALLCHFKATLITYEEGKEKVRAVWYGGIPVKFPARDERLFKLVVRVLARSLLCF